MLIIIPEDYKDFEFLKEDAKHFLKYKVILSPFMYMNYEDAIRETYKIFKGNSYYTIIIDLTGLTVELFNIVLGIDFVDNPVGPSFLCTNFFFKNHKTFTAIENETINVLNPERKLKMGFSVQLDKEKR